MNSERLSNFNVINPQLEANSTTFRTGRKMFRTYKNEVSPAILAAIPSLSSEEKIKPSLATSLENYSRIAHNNSLSTQRKAFDSPLRQNFNYSKRQSDYFKTNNLIGSPFKQYDSLSQSLRMANYGLNVFTQRFPSPKAN